MPSMEQIVAGVNEIVPEFPIEKVALFGSYAEGKNRPDSDIDLLVEFSSPRVSLILLNRLKYRLEERLRTRVDVIHGPLAGNSMIEIGRSVPLYEA